jgi:ribosomal protein S12 methylthiotransferase
MSARPLKVNIVTLGCSKNKVDSEHLAALIPGKRFKVVHDSDTEADVVIVNTCGFIADAKEESVDTILGYANQRKKGLIRKLVVMGCLSERYRKDLESEIHEVDAFFGVNDLTGIALYLADNDSDQFIEESYHYKRQLSTPSHYAYLKISEGCNRQCSFCAIPLIRGMHKSVPVPDLIRESSYLAQSGVKELILIAQDITSYGLDLNNKRGLPDLVRQLCSIGGLEWIRLQYAYPSGFPLRILDVMAEQPKVCRYIDLPLQHISDRMLKAMKRGLGQHKTLQLIDDIRNRVPDIAFRTTLITGFPGESDEDFQMLASFVRDQRFDRLGVFTYSPEEGTSAFRLGDPIPDAVKQERLEHLMEIQQDISLELNRQKVGKQFKVLIDREESEYYVGRTEYDSPEVDNEVLVSKKHEGIRIGNFYPISIISAGEFDLFGEPV